MDDASLMEKSVHLTVSKYNNPEHTQTFLSKEQLLAEAAQQGIDEAVLQRNLPRVLSVRCVDCALFSISR
jgi:hypothetical protein